MKIATNLTALQSVMKLKKTEKSILSSSMKLNTGYKINRSADDSAGKAIGTKLDKQIVMQEKANQNTLDAVSLVQTTDGALAEVHNILQRMRELAVNSSNGVLTDDDRNNINIEISELREEIDSISQKTNFNGIKTLQCYEDSNKNYPSLKIQVGEGKHMEMEINLFRMSSDTLGIDVLDYRTIQGSQKAIEVCDDAISKVSEYRTYLGSYENRLMQTSQNTDSMLNSTKLSLSRIMDTDMAVEITNYTKLSVISQAATSILAQANQRPQQILQLLS